MSDSRMWMRVENNVGTCPVCGDDMTPNDMERRVGKCHDIYTCHACEIGVTYITPDDGREYHQYRGGEIEIVFEPGA